MGEDDLRASLRGRLDAGGRIFVPYVTGGLPSVDAELLRGVAKAGADAIEVGIPFSDPVIDGAVIQTASQLALEAGATPSKVLGTIAEAAIDVPVVVMTYLNPVYRHGMEGFLREAVEAGVSGVIVPDLPVDEASEWIVACSSAGLAPVFLAAPGTSDARLRDVASASRGFVYCVATYGVTGERAALEETSRALVERLRPFATEPLIVGVGIGTPSQATEACGFADGVIVGTAIVRALLEDGPDAMVARVSAFRDAIPLGAGA
ncbi:MAG: tryptophan synthase subunit alpha [Actinomycetota bacterium]